MTLWISPYVWLRFGGDFVLYPLLIAYRDGCIEYHSMCIMVSMPLNPPSPPENVSVFQGSVSQRGCGVSLGDLYTKYYIKIETKPAYAQGLIAPLIPVLCSSVHTTTALYLTIRHLGYLGHRENEWKARQKYLTKWLFCTTKLALLFMFLSSLDKRWTWVLLRSVCSCATVMFAELFFLFRVSGKWACVFLTKAVEWAWQLPAMRSDTCGLHLVSLMISARFLIPPIPLSFTPLMSCSWTYWSLSTDGLATNVGFLFLWMWFYFCDTGWIV